MPFLYRSDTEELVPPLAGDDPYRVMRSRWFTVAIVLQGINAVVQATNGAWIAAVCAGIFAVGFTTLRVLHPAPALDDLAEPDD